jgi:hypothetical protein
MASDGVIQLGWIRASNYCALKGESIETVQERINNATWAAGKHYKRTGPRTLWIHWENVNAWIEKLPHTNTVPFPKGSKFGEANAATG